MGTQSVASGARHTGASESTGRESSPARSRELLHFLLLDRDQQVQAIRRLRAQGMSVSTISAATRLSIEQLNEILGGPKP